MHKRLVYPLMVILLVLALASCNSASDETTTPNGSGANGNGQPTREISEDLQLMMGTVLLDNTNHAIDTDQAAELLPLWKVLNTMAGSETAAQIEVDAVIASIQDAMTPEQIAAIDAMDLTMADMGQVFQILGIETNFGGGFDQMTEEQQATMEAMRDSGDFPQGGPGGDFPQGGPGTGMGPGGGMRPGGEFSGGAEFSPEMRETAMAGRENGIGRGFGINTQLLEAIISFLEAK